MFQNFTFLQTYQISINQLTLRGITDRIIKEPHYNMVRVTNHQ